jgi:hypothetical protein
MNLCMVPGISGPTKCLGGGKDINVNLFEQDNFRERKPNFRRQMP